MEDSEAMVATKSWYTEVGSRTLSSDDLPSELLRGITPKKLLSVCGKVLRKRPDSLSVEKQSNLFKLSTPVDSLDFFISHCWSSAGWQKYLSLMLHLFGDWAFVLGSVASLLVLHAQVYLYELPSFATRYNDLFDLSWDISVWELYIGMVVFWSVLVFAHTLFNGRSVFFDSVCIHQTDIDKKMTGITHLGSFLRASKTFLILWDNQYLNRGWCVYELAAFIHLNPRGRIVILPLKLSVAKLCFNPTTFIGHATFITIWPLHTSSLIGLVAMWLGVFAAGCFASFSLDWYQRDVVALRSQLDTFDFNKTQITVESDRESILTSINDMYPNGGVTELNRIVRTEVKQVLLKEFSKQRCAISYRDSLWATFPAICGCAAYFSSCRHLSGPFLLAFLVFIVTLALGFTPLAFALLGLLARRGVETKEDRLIRLYTRYICGAAAVSVLMVAFACLVYYLPCAVAVGRVPNLAQSEIIQVIIGDPWNGFVIALVNSLIIWLPCIWFFWPSQAN